MNEYAEFLEHFYHTRQSLEAFEACPLKFYKRYFEGLRWERPLRADERAAIDRGSDFHMLARRYFLGVDTGLSEGIEDFETLSLWLKNLKGAFGLRKDVSYLPEYKLRYEDSEIRLEANFDLVAAVDGRLEIWDWKTHAANSTKEGVNSSRLAKSLQTVVYLYVLKERSTAVFGKEYGFGDIGMYYWQPDMGQGDGSPVPTVGQRDGSPVPSVRRGDGSFAPAAKVIAEINYSRELHDRYGVKLRELVRRIEAFDIECFDKSYVKSCRYCEYNWYCNHKD